MEIEKRWKIYFLEIGMDRDHAHFLVRSVPSYSVTKIVLTLKGVTTREVFKQVPEVRNKLWGGEFWGKGYFVNTVGQYGSEKMIAEYVKNQGRESEYQQLHKAS